MGQSFLHLWNKETMGQNIRSKKRWKPFATKLYKVRFKSILLVDNILTSETHSGVI